MKKLLPIVLALATTQSTGAIYTCTEVDGVRAFSDTPCSGVVTVYEVHYRPSSAMPIPPQKTGLQLEAENQAARDKAELEELKATVRDMATRGQANNDGGLSSSEQNRLVRNKKVARGMDEKHLYESWGKPNSSYRRFNDDGTITHEYIYKATGYSRAPRRVYMRHGKVIDVFNQSGRH